MRKPMADPDIQITFSHLAFQAAKRFLQARLQAVSISGYAPNKCERQRSS
jgi:hypothetical protein